MLSIVLLNGRLMAPLLPGNSELSKTELGRIATSYLLSASISVQHFVASDSETESVFILF
jgi:hypothetical protein